MASNQPVTAADRKADTNNDGVLSQKEKAAAAKKAARPTAAQKKAAANRGQAKTMAPQVGSATGLTQDRLNKKQLRGLYDITARQLQVDDDLFNLFQKAYDGQWDKARFESELEQTDWYRTNAAPMRTYLLLKAEGGADWDKKVADSREMVRQRALQMGVNVDAQTIENLANDSMMFGWGENGEDYELQRRLSQMQSVNGQYGGDIQMNSDNLRGIAQANNVKLDPNWFMSKARAIAGGYATPEDVEREIRQMGAEKSPLFSQQILAGENLTDLVSPWRRLMADEWELADSQIALDDPMLQKAVGGFDEQGNPTRMSLGDFQIALRQDPRWQNTRMGKNKITSTYADVLKMFGMGN